MPVRPPRQVHKQVEQHQAAEPLVEISTAATADRQEILARAAGSTSQRLLANFAAEGEPCYHLVKYR